MGTRQDLRAHPRVLALQAAELASQGAPAAACVVEDISAGGARVLSACRLSPGAQVVLRLPAGPTLAGEVVYRFEPGDGGYGYGYGVAFTAAARGLAAAAALGAGEGGAPRFLVVHPDRATCRLLLRELAAAGAPATGAADASDARRLLEALRPALRHVLVEAETAESDAVDLLDHLAQDHPEVGRIVLCHPIYPTMSIRRRPAPSCRMWAPPWHGPRLRELLAELAP